MVTATTDPTPETETGTEAKAGTETETEGGETQIATTTPEIEERPTTETEIAETTITVRNALKDARLLEKEKEKAGRPSPTGREFLAVNSRRSIILDNSPRPRSLKITITGPSTTEQPKGLSTPADRLRRRKRWS
jgi:hypothetical protein